MREEWKQFRPIVSEGEDVRDYKYMHSKDYKLMLLRSNYNRLSRGSI